MMHTTEDILAAEAIAEIEDGMTVGLGTGRAASRGIIALAAKVKTESLDLQCVATSARSAELATSLGLKVIPMTTTASIDILFDGVDELDPNLAMTKGGGGAMTREKIVAEAAQRRIYLMQQSKVVEKLGQHFKLPVEVLEFALASVQNHLQSIGLDDTTVRTDPNDPNMIIRTDEHNLILDCAYGDCSSRDLRLLDQSINAIPGVVGHGLFVDQADVVLIESDDDCEQSMGEVERRERS